MTLWDNPRCGRLRPSQNAVHFFHVELEIEGSLVLVVADLTHELVTIVAAISFLAGSNLVFGLGFAFDGIELH